MKRIEITPHLAEFPAEFHSILQKYPVYTSHCSQEARVWFVDGDGGYYLKTSAKSSLETEAAMTRYFHGKGLSAEVLDYRSLDRDWMLTRAVRGEDCTFERYLEDPKRLCDTLAVLLRQLHETDFTGCPVTDRCGVYRARAEQNRDRGAWDLSLFPETDWGFSSAEEAWNIVCSNGNDLRNDTLLHGDYCLPNILLDDWKFSGFIDLDCGGVGDKHIDLFWGVWTLLFNLKTNAYYDRFLDAYGRDRVEPELLRTVAAFEVFG